MKHVNQFDFVFFYRELNVLSSNTNTSLTCASYMHYHESSKLLFQIAINRSPVSSNHFSKSFNQSHCK